MKLFSRASLARCCLTLACALSAPAFAQADLAKKGICMSCHQVEKKVVGPAFKDVAAKYAGHPEAVAALTQNVLKGGGGVWGPVPMPAITQVSETEAKQLVLWVLSQK